MILVTLCLQLTILLSYAQKMSLLHFNCLHVAIYFFFVMLWLETYTRTKSEEERERAMITNSTKKEHKTHKNWAQWVAFTEKNNFKWKNELENLPMRVVSFCCCLLLHSHFIATQLDVFWSLRYEEDFHCQFYISLDNGDPRNYFRMIVKSS